MRPGAGRTQTSARRSRRRGAGAGEELGRAADLGAVAQRRGQARPRPSSTWPARTWRKRSRADPAGCSGARCSASGGPQLVDVVDAVGVDVDLPVVGGEEQDGVAEGRGARPEERGVQGVERAHGGLGERGRGRAVQVAGRVDLVPVEVGVARAVGVGQRGRQGARALVERRERVRGRAVEGDRAEGRAGDARRPEGRAAHPAVGEPAVEDGPGARRRTSKPAGDERPRRVVAGEREQQRRRSRAPERRLEDVPLVQRRARATGRPKCSVVTCAVVVDGNCERSGATSRRRTSGWSAWRSRKADPKRVEQHERDAVVLAQQALDLARDDGEVRRRAHPRASASRTTGAPGAMSGSRRSSRSRQPGLQLDRAAHALQRGRAGRPPAAADRPAQKSSSWLPGASAEARV